MRGISYNDWREIAHHYVDWDDDDLPACSECGRLLEPDEADFDICPECIDREEGKPDLERLMMEVIENRSDLGDESLDVW